MAGLTAELEFCCASRERAGEIARLVNSAYRGETSKLGWTSEADLLDGVRTNQSEVAQLIAAGDCLLAIAQCGGELLASVQLQHLGAEVRIGMLAVKPQRQAQGIGKGLLAYAENLAAQTWRFDKYTMAVIACRTELLAFYLRRGYRDSGLRLAFPLNPQLWTPKSDALGMMLLEKPLAPRTY